MEAQPYPLYRVPVHPLIQRAVAVVPQHEPGGFQTGSATGTFGWDVSGRNSKLIDRNLTPPVAKAVIEGGRAWTFDGTNDVLGYRASSFAASALNNGYTVAIVVRGNAAPSAAKVGQAISCGPIFSWDHTSAGFRQAWFHGGIQVAKLTTTLAANITYWTCGTFDGSTVRAYLNGRLEASAAATVQAYNTALLGTIGAHTTPANYFAGEVGSVVILPYALPLQAASQLYVQMMHGHAHLKPSFLRFAAFKNLSTSTVYLQGDRYLNYKDLQPGYTVQSQGFTGSKRY